MLRFKVMHDIISFKIQYSFSSNDGCNICVMLENSTTELQAFFNAVAVGEGVRFISFRDVSVLLRRCRFPI